jgi:hypothetical protein
MGVGSLDLFAPLHLVYLAYLPRYIYIYSTGNEKLTADVDMVFFGTFGGSRRRRRLVILFCLE